MKFSRKKIYSLVLPQYILHESLTKEKKMVRILNKSRKEEIEDMEYVPDVSIDLLCARH